ncbi:unnamed protein product [Paramecium sonneborni]|uniref:EF-hand domain-containing protein n=1 Tax=Paramecium sonneborni TaxID=65129 RepID=A0A8S1KZZ1_9CILI|nr:unnamed protein product [Paramecium sonneborni]
MISKNNLEFFDQFLSIFILDNMQEFKIDIMLTPQQLGIQFCEQFGLNLNNLQKVAQNLIRFIQAASEKPQYSQLTKCYEKYFGEREEMGFPFKSSYELSEFLVENKFKFKKSKSQSNLVSMQKENLQQIQKNNVIIQQPNKQLFKNRQNFDEKNRFENLYIQGKLKQIERNKSRQTHIDKLDVIDDNCTFRPNTKINRQNQQSEKINLSTQLKQEKYYKQLFNYLDNDKDGMISKNCIDISKLNLNDQYFGDIVEN